MQKQKTSLVGMAMMAAALCPACVLAQTNGPSSSGTSGLASDQAHISSPGTNSLGTADSVGYPPGTTVGANMSSDSKRIDAEIRAEDARVDAKINNICRGC
jgi:hypothetical protein